MDAHELAYDMREMGRLGLVDAVDDSGPVQLVDVTINDGVQHTQIPVMQIAGLASIPAVGGVVLLVSIGADPANMRALPIVSTWRFGGLVAGEAVLYGADGTRVACRADGHMDILAKTTIEISAQNGVNITGDVAVTGSLNATGNISDGHGSMELIRQEYDGHSHDGGALPSPQMAD
jgi:phage gp45-like